MKEIIEIGLVLILLIYIMAQQLKAQPIAHKTKTYGILFLVGIYFVYQNWQDLRWNVGLIGAIILGDLLCPALFGYLRAQSSRIFIGDDGVINRQGTWLTLIFWGSFILVRACFGYFIKGSETFLLISLAVSLFVQNEITWSNAKRHFPKAIQKNLAFQAEKQKNRS